MVRSCILVVGRVCESVDVRGLVNELVSVRVRVIVLVPVRALVLVLVLLLFVVV